MVKLFIDTASVKEIREFMGWGVISGVTTNQKIFLAEKGANFEERVKEILSLVNGPLHVELTANSMEDMILEATRYASWHPNVVIKVPMMGDGTGLKVTSKLAKMGVNVNMTLLMSANQVLLAALAGAVNASLFYNRIKDAGGDPAKVVRESRHILDDGSCKTQLLVGSIRKPDDIIEAAVSGAQIITVTPKIFAQLPYHPKTEETLKEFNQAWEEFKQAEGKILGSS